MNVFEPAQTGWASPVRFAPKQDGSLRFFVAYRKINAVTVGNSCPLPSIDEHIDLLGDGQIF